MALWMLVAAVVSSLRVGVDGVVEDALQRDEGRGLLVLPEVLRDARHLAADRAVEDVGEYSLLDRGHVDIDAGDGLLVLRGFADSDGAADRVAGFVAGGEGIAPGGVAAVAVA